MIELLDVNYTIDERKIIDHVHFTSNHKRIGVIGRNGSGKSTLARLMAGLITPQSGSVLIDGVAVAKDRKAAVTTVGILFQNPDHQIIFPTVAEEIAFGLTQQGQSKAQAEAATQTLLAHFKLEGWMDCHVNSLSHGQKQLVCLLAIFIMNPKVLIMDEPLSGLDLPTKLQLKRYFDLYEGCLIHITHAPDLLTDYDQILWLEQGRIHSAGTSEQILPNFTKTMTELGNSDDLNHLPN